MSRQQINLYQPLKKERQMLSAGHMLMVAGLTVICLAAVYAWLFFAHSKLEQQLQVSKKQQQQLTSTLQMAAEKRNIKANPILEARLRQMEKEKARRVPLINWFETQFSEGTEGFVPMLNGLTRQDLPDLWLRQIRISDNGHQLRLQGNALAPEQIPAYLERLGNETVFQGISFVRVLVARSEASAKQVTFTLDTAPGEQQ